MKLRDVTNHAVLAQLKELEIRHNQFRKDPYQLVVFSEVEALREGTLSLIHEIRERVEEASTPATSGAASALSTTVVPVPAPEKHHSRLKIDLPTFSGSPLDWHDFWKLFSSILDRETDLSDAECICLLVKAMKGQDALDVAWRAAAKSDSYHEVTDALKQRYEQNQVVFPQHLRTLLSKRKVSYMRKDLQETRERWSQHRRGLLHCGGYTAGQILAAILEDFFDDTLSHE